MRIESDPTNVRPRSTETGQGEPAVGAKTPFEDWLKRPEPTTPPDPFEEEDHRCPGFPGAQATMPQTDVAVGNLNGGNGATRTGRDRGGAPGLPEGTDKATAINLCVTRTPGGDASALFTIRSDRLGSIQVLAELNGGEVQAFLGAEREESARILEKHRDDLKGRLEQAGGQASVKIDLGEEGVLERFRERVAQQTSGQAAPGVGRYRESNPMGEDIIRLQCV